MRASTLRGGVGQTRLRRLGRSFAFASPNALSTAGPSLGANTLASSLGDDNGVVEFGAASKSNSSCCVLCGGFLRGEVMPRISSLVALGGGAAVFWGPARCGVGWGVGRECCGWHLVLHSAGNPACAGKARRGARWTRKIKERVLSFPCFATPGTSQLRHG